MVTSTNPKPLYEQLKCSIKSRILSGDYKPKTKLPSQISLSKEYRVSQITVRRAIQELVEEKLLFARPGSGTYVTSEDQVIKTPMCDINIAMIFEDLVGGYPLVKTTCATIRDKCREYGYSLQFLEIYPVDPSGRSRNIEKIESSNCTAAVLTSPVDLTIMAKLISDNIPYVLLQNNLCDGFSCSVSCNYASAIFQATNHLIEQGCKKLALIAAEQIRYSAGQMALGFNLALKTPGNIASQINGKVIYANYTGEMAYKITKNWIENNDIPDGIIYASDDMAKVGIFAFQQAGIAVPEQVAIVGFGNILKPHDSAILISTVEPHLGKTGLLAIEILRNLIEGKKPKTKRVLVEPEMIFQQSSVRK
jgi:DNA-binding LacI/PurR family transcriptional regulator